MSVFIIKSLYGVSRAIGSFPGETLSQLVKRCKWIRKKAKSKMLDHLEKLETVSTPRFDNGTSYRVKSEEFTEVVVSAFDIAEKLSAYWHNNTVYKTNYPENILKEIK